MKAVITALLLILILIGCGSKSEKEKSDACYEHCDNDKCYVVRDKETNEITDVICL